MRSFVLGLLLLAQLFVLLGPTFPVPRVWALETVYDTLTGNTADPDVSDWNDIGGGELAGSVYVDPSVEATLISATFELCGSFGVQAGGFDLLVFPTTGAVAQKPTGDAPVWPDLGTAIARSDVYAQATDFNLGWTGTTCNGTLFTFEFSGVNRITLVPGTDYGFIFRKQTTTLGPIHYYQDPDGPQIDRCASFEGVGWSCEDITGVPLLVTGQVEAGGWRVRHHERQPRRGRARNASALIVFALVTFSAVYVVAAMRNQLSPELVKAGAVVVVILVMALALTLGLSVAVGD